MIAPPSIPGAPRSRFFIARRKQGSNELFEGILNFAQHAYLRFFILPDKPGLTAGRKQPERLCEIR
jgi:hypothetical protein